MELEIIKNSILEIRGKKVMLDMDLAKLYEVETRVLKQAVRRNKDRFPSDFMFQLTEIEMQHLVSQNVIPTINHFGGAKPFAFSEQGIAMLSSVLKSKKAIHMNISIMRAFVMMRQWALNHQELSEKLTALEQQYGQKFKDIEQVLNYLIQKDQKSIQQAARKEIGFKK
jgi:hypothetical protein